jgi:hypothetical protein
MMHSFSAAVNVPVSCLEVGKPGFCACREIAAGRRSTQSASAEY